MARVGWHKADIKSELEKRGYTLSRLAHELEPPVAPSTVAQVLRNGRSLRIEAKIAAIIGVSAARLWPERYNSRAGAAATSLSPQSNEAAPRCVDAGLDHQSLAAAGWQERLVSTLNGLGERRAVATATGISEGQLYRYLRNTNIPSWTAVITIATIAGVSLDWLACRAADSLIAPASPVAEAEVNVQLLASAIAASEAASAPATSLERADLAARMYAALVRELPITPAQEVPHD